MCSGLIIPDNGAVVYSTGLSTFYDYQTSATYFCDTGFGISEGTVIRTCGGDGSTPNGTWTGNDAVCEGKKVAFNAYISIIIIVLCVKSISIRLTYTSESKGWSLMHVHMHKL